VRIPRPLAPGFLSVAVLLLASAPALAADQAPPAPAEDSVAPSSPLAAEPLDRLSATRERPLFSPTRRPPPPPPTVVSAPDPPPPPPPPPTVALFGVVVDGDEVHAIVRTGPAAPVKHVRIGDDIDGWKVAQIEERRLVLVLDDRVATFTMFAGNRANGVPQGGAVAPPVETTSRGQTQPPNQTPQREPAPPAHRRRGSLAVQQYSMVK
jgi:hypothetical protein